MSEVSLEGYSPMDPKTQQDPFPHYEALRKLSPALDAGGGIVFVSTHAAVLDVLQQPNTFSSQIGGASVAPPVPGSEAEIQALYADAYPPVSTMLTLDPPLQTRYRKAVGRALSTRRVEALEPRIRARAVELLDACPDEGRIDFMNQLSIPFPVRVIADLLSMPVAREADVKRWSDDSVASIGVEITPERAIEATRSIVEMQHFVASLLAMRRETPADDFLSELVAADFEDADGDTRKLRLAEMISIVQQLMVAGNEATTKGITEIMKILVEHPDEWKRMREDPAAIPTIVEEGLRLASPNQGLFRICTKDTEVAGTPVAKGQMLWVMFGSANRDEQIFPDPDRFDPSRPNLSDTFAFGRGAHYCIGAPLARLEIRVLFEELSRRWESVRFAPGTTLEYEPSFILRGLKELVIDVA